jgi:hypothetical protein
MGNTQTKDDQRGEQPQDDQGIESWIKAILDPRSITGHVSLLLDSGQNITLSPITRSGTPSSYIPTAFNMFAMLDEMCHRLVGNHDLDTMWAGFFSPVLHLYYAHVVYFHILRARAAAGSDILTPSERRVLAKYEGVARAERWPIAAPLIVFIQAMGAHQPAGSYNSWVVPTLPDFSRLNKHKGLAGLENVTGMLRLPVIPALQKLLHNFSTGDARYEHRILYPATLPLSNTNQFVGISSSARDSQAFLAITYNLCWKMPHETGNDHPVNMTAVKRDLLDQWNVPDVPNDATLNTAEGFLGFASHKSPDWMRNMLKVSEFANRFFPGSTSLANIPPSTTIGSLTHVEYRRSTVPRPANDTWYYRRRAGVSLSFNGFSNTENGHRDTGLGIAASPNAEFPCFFPHGPCAASASPVRKGPFFVDDPDAEESQQRSPKFLCRGSSTTDPASLFPGIIDEHFDPKGRGTTTW